MNRSVFFSLAAAAILAAMPSAFAQDIQTFTVNNVSFKMVPVKTSRSFKMGATPEQREEAMPDEYPAHQVTLSEYALGETEVTQELWKAVMGDNPSLFQLRGSIGNQFPVERVSYEDCQRFISKLNALTGNKFRLPTEAEWEFAARGDLNSLYAGSGGPGIGWYIENSEAHPHKVKECGWGDVRAQISGLYNLSGNVAEWCSDWKGPYSEESQFNPKGPASGSERICRGGGWSDVAWRCRTSARSSHAPSYKSSALGFRLALSLSSPIACYLDPVVRECKKESLHLDSVEVTENETILNFSYTGDNSSASFYIERDAYIRDRITSCSYRLVRLQNATYRPDKTWVGNNTVSFSLIFEKIPTDCTVIDFIESSYSDWNMTNIELR